MYTRDDSTALAMPISLLSQRHRLVMILTHWQAGLFRHWLIPDKTTGSLFPDDNTRTLASKCNLCPPPPPTPNSYVEILILHVMVLGCGAFGRWHFSYMVMRVEPSWMRLVLL